MILAKVNNEYYLVNADLKRMAKDLPAGTLVFCLDEIHTNDPKESIRHSSVGDHCYGCQPLIASTTKINELPLLDKANIESLIQEEKNFLAEVFIKKERVQYFNFKWNRTTTYCEMCGDGTDSPCDHDDCHNSIPKVEDGKITITKIMPPYYVVNEADHTKMGEDHCPACNYLCDSASALNEPHSTPNPGDVSICLNCGELLEFSSDMALIEIRKETLSELEPKQLQELYNARAHIKARGFLK